MGQSPTTAKDSAPARARARLARPASAALLIAAAVGAVLASSDVLAAVCVLAVVALAGALGWRLGDEQRRGLRRQIDDRSIELRRALTELEIAQAETVRRLSMAVEFRDEDTGAHIERIGRFSTLLAEQVGIETDRCELLGYAAPLHDVGKVAIPDAILLKPGPLTREERAIVETHTEEGYRLLRGSSSSILDMAATIALSHHEKWDGNGYPRGLAGEEIPIEGRIVAIADVFDALTSDRVYRPAFPIERAIEMMREQRAQHFDPVLLDAFMEVISAAGVDARGIVKPDREALLEGVLETFSSALERGDAEAAEGAIAQAIEEEVPPVMLHGEVIAPALARIGELAVAGAIDRESEQLATGIARRVLATLHRFMLGGAEPTRERVLLAGIEGDLAEPGAHTLGLQMVHDQLAAAGYQTTLDTDVSAERLQAAIERHAPAVLVLGASAVALGAPLEELLDELREQHSGLPVLLAGAATGAAPGELLHAPPAGTPLLERIDGAVPAVEELLRARAHVLG